MIRSGKYLILFFCFLFAGISLHGQDLFNADNSRKFAQYLLNTHQYNLAAVEYERILSVSSPDAEITSQLLKTYRLGEICEHAFLNFRTLETIRFLKDETVAKEYLNLALFCNCCFQQNNFEKAIASLRPKEQAFYRLGHYFFNNENDSLFRFTRINRELLSNSYPSVFNTIQALENFGGKSPGLSMAMSAVLPGSGKAYAGYWGDAIMSFVFVSSNAWLSYRGFNKKGVKSVSGWIFGGVSLGFYLGNIWGSGQAARTYNRIEYEKLYNEAQNSIYSHF